jgi:hypothetical protein
MDMEQRIVAFADEFGNNSFDFNSQGTHFVIATILCKAGNIEKLKSEIDQIRIKHRFQTGEIKSSKVAQDHSRRKRILTDIVKLDIYVYAVIVDKRGLSGEGFKYKKSFYKFLNNLLYKELYRTFPNLDLYVDELGGNDFMREFKRYVARTHNRTLFSGANFNLQNSKQSEIIQIADFVAGTLGYIFDESKRSEHSNEFQTILNPIITDLSHFPRRLSFDEFESSKLDIDSSFDKRIAEVSISRIHDYLDRENGADKKNIDKMRFLKLLLWHLRISPINEYMTTTEILSHLNQNREKIMGEESFRNSVVGPLRDKGILIASGRSGYKIPTSAKDLDSFVRHGNRIITPMLGRIDIARKAIKLATTNELDLLEKNEYKGLRVLLDEN